MLELNCTIYNSFTSELILGKIRSLRQRNHDIKLSLDVRSLSDHYNFENTDSDLLDFVRLNDNTPSIMRQFKSFPTFYVTLSKEEEQSQGYEYVWDGRNY